MKCSSCILFFTLYCYSTVNSRPIASEQEDVAQSTRSPTGAVATVEFLRKYGYLDSRSSNNTEFIETKESIKEGIMLMQRYGGLKETGEVDADTIQLLSKARCGVADIVRPSGNHTRKKRFAIASSGWDKRTITYSFQNWSPKLGQHAAENGMKKAFEAWADYANLRFVRKPANSDADISISFSRLYHGDSYPFDGKGLVLAHAYYPTKYGTFSGDIHFDEDEDWWSSDGVQRNRLESPISFSFVAAHELGHSLGLAHSSDSDSIMFAYYNGELGKDPKLGYDDIMAVYKLYVERNIPEGEGDSDYERPRVSSTDTPRRPTRTTTSTRRPITQATTGKTTVAYSPPSTSPRPTTTRATITTTRRPETTARVTEFHTTTTVPARPTSTVETTTAKKYPERPTTPTVRDSEKDFESKEGDLCSGASVKIAFLRNEIFVFRGQNMWRLAEIGSPPPPAYPVKIANLFPPLAHVEGIDAAYERSTDGHLIFFSGNRYWEMDGTRAVHGSPKPLTELGLPPSIAKLDGAFIWGKNKLTYFFSGESYWRYNETSKEMDKGYPQSMNSWRGIPSPIDSVLRYKDGKTYFFRGNDFWRFDDVMVKAEENFPLSINDYWLGC